MDTTSVRPFQMLLSWCIFLTVTIIATGLFKFIVTPKEHLFLNISRHKNEINNVHLYCHNHNTHKVRVLEAYGVTIWFSMSASQKKYFVVCSFFMEHNSSSKPLDLQIISFLQQNAHPRVAERVPAVPENVTDQVFFSFFSSTVKCKLPQWCCFHL